MSAFGGDTLETVYEREASTTHAIYPTASTTLCGVSRDQVEELGGSLPPVCEPCFETAHVFHRIDRSAPAKWFTYSERS